MLFDNISHFLDIMTDVDKIKIILSTDAEFEITYTDDVYMDTDGILIIRSNGDRITVNVNYIVFATFIRR